MAILVTDANEMKMMVGTMFTVIFLDAFVIGL
jgi:hypothetical protein